MCRRGKHDQKVYTVFVARTSAEVMSSFRPELNKKEHRDWRWIPVDDMQDMKVPLHPVVDMVIHDKEHNSKLHSLFSSAA